MPVIDDFGTWENIGQVNPVGDDWQPFPFFPTKETSALKLFFYGDFKALRDWRVSCWLRALYFSGNQYFFDHKWLRLYPKGEPEIITYDFPADLIVDPLPTRQFEVKRRLTFRNKPFRDLTPNFGVQLLAKTDSQVIYPGDRYPAVLEEEQNA